MKFGKVSTLEGIDFDLPPDHPQTREVLQASKGDGQPRVFLGATGWGNREWVGSWYPRRTKQSEYLRHYSKQFGTIEFNSTHYRVPTQDMVARWKDLAAPGFTFCPKVPQSISHFQHLQGPGSSTQEFVDAIHGLDEFLGPVFLQMPERTRPSHCDVMWRNFRDWSGRVPLHLELRHPDFFLGTSEVDDFYSALQELGQGTVITDVAGRRDVLHMRLTNPVLVLRFVGNGLHSSDYSRVDAWTRRLKQWIDLGLQEAYLFIHQPEMKQVPEYTRYWAQKIAEHCDLQVRKPELVEEARQGSLF